MDKVMVFLVLILLVGCVQVPVQEPHNFEISPKNESIISDVSLENQTESIKTNVSTKDDKIERGIVTYIADGDTIKAEVNGQKMTIRFLGINAPEITHGNNAGECFGEEAKKKTKELLLDKEVVLSKDSLQGDKDRFDRYLRYVELNGTDVGELLVKEGYANTYTKIKSDRMLHYSDVELLAKKEKNGLWAVCS